MHSYNGSSDWLRTHVWDCDACCQLANGLSAEPELLLRGVAWNRVSWVFSLSVPGLLVLSLSPAARSAFALIDSAPPTPSLSPIYISTRAKGERAHAEKLPECFMQRVALAVGPDPKRSEQSGAFVRTRGSSLWEHVGRAAGDCSSAFSFLRDYRLHPCVKSPIISRQGLPSWGGGAENEPGCIVYEASLT